jgi:hypothetical protein
MRLPDYNTDSQRPVTQCRVSDHPRAAICWIDGQFLQIVPNFWNRERTIVPVALLESDPVSQAGIYLFIPREPREGHIISA